MTGLTALRALCLACALAVGSAAHAAPELPSADVAWLPAAADADIERAFAQARSEGKPVLLYWGATWCPPCNQLKATLFNRQDFITQSRAFVAVHVDGDRPGAQKLGTRFKVRGYPTLILFDPSAREITRLPGEVDAPQVLKVLQLGLAGGRPVKAVLDDARAGKALALNDWRLLAYYSWETDEQQLMPEAQRASQLAALAAAVPAGEREIATRLWLKALAQSDGAKGIKPDAALQKRVRALLADASAVRSQADVLVNEAPAIVRTMAPQPGREQRSWAGAFDGALKGLQADATLSRADRLGALLARVELARIEQPKDAKRVELSKPLLAEVRTQVARDDREIRDAYERQAVITSAAYLLGRAGLWDESDALLKSNLEKSHSPYYLMSQLGGNAKQRGDNVEALRWYEQAYQKSVGPATRLQWGSSYLGALVDLAPQDAARIEQAATQLIADAAQDPGAFHERSARSLQRAASKLNAWNANGKHAATLERLQARLDPVCGKLDSAERTTCDALLKQRAS